MKKTRMLGSAMTVVGLYLGLITGASLKDSVDFEHHLLHTQGMDMDDSSSMGTSSGADNGDGGLLLETRGRIHEKEYLIAGASAAFLGGMALMVFDMRRNTLAPASPRMTAIM